MIKCIVCKERTKNPKFCSRSCAAKFNNVHFPKRKLEGKCKICNIPITSHRSYCKNCISKGKRIPGIPINPILCSIKDMHKDRKYQRSSRIRAYARQTYDESGKPKECMACGYNKIYHVCHKTPIHKFDINTKLSVVNSIDNLIALCPNHHWEFDHNLLKI